MGFHTGSLIGTELARSRPERVRRLVVFGLAAYPADMREAKLAALLQNFPPPGDNLDHVEKLWAIIQQLSDPRMGAEEKHVNMAECLRLGTRMPWGYIAVYRYDFLGAMAEVEQPVLIMNPDDDLGAVTKATAHLYRNGTRFDLPGVKHGVLSIEHDRVVARIEEFLQMTQAEPNMLLNRARADAIMDREAYQRDCRLDAGQYLSTSAAGRPMPAGVSATWRWRCCRATMPRSPLS